MINNSSYHSTLYLLLIVTHFNSNSDSQNTPRPISVVNSSSYNSNAMYSKQ